MKPFDAIGAIYPMRDKVNPDSIIISCVTGLNIDVMGRVYSGNQKRFVKCTLNLGIGYGTGMVVYNTPSDKTAEEVEKFFSPLVMVIKRRSSKKTNIAVTIVGSGPAFFAKCLFMRYEKEGGEFTEFLNSLTIDEAGVRNYIEAFKYACRMLFDDDTLVEDSVMSTLETLKKCCFCPEDLLLFIKRVATKKGSTETKINDFDSLELVTAAFFITALAVIHRKVKYFEKLIQTDLKGLNLPVDERSKTRIYSFSGGCSKM
jgi:pyrroline-5-carboxylate reductase